MLLPTMKRLSQDNSGISNVIVVMLSLVLVVIIVSNVVLSSYQMNQFDWERMQEKVQINNVIKMSGSPWSVAQSEYTVNFGNPLSGSYVDTQAVDRRYETFVGNTSESERALEVAGAFAIDLTALPLMYIQTVEVQLTYRVNDSSESWFLEAFNWTLGDYSSNGFNSTETYSGTTDWDTYAVNLTDEWESYLSGSGSIYVKIRDSQGGPNQASIDIDFLGVRAKVTQGATITLQNEGSVTAHLVSLWVDTSTIHQRYDMNLFINAGDSINYTRADIVLVDNASFVKITTERGTVSTFKIL